MNMRELTGKLNAMTVLILSGARTEEEVRRETGYTGQLPGRILDGVTDCLAWLQSLQENALEVPAEYCESMQVEVEPEQQGLRIRVDGFATPLMHRFDVEELMVVLRKALDETEWK